MNKPLTIKNNCRKPNEFGFPEKNQVTYQFPGTKYTTDKLEWIWQDGSGAPKKHKDLNVSLMSGHQGQYVIMIPEKELIITRLGERDIDLGGPGVSGDVLTYIDEALKLIED